MFKLPLNFVLAVKGNYFLEGAAIENEIVNLFFLHCKHVAIQSVHNCFDSGCVESVFFLPLGLGCYACLENSKLPHELPSVPFLAAA
jgi:hypothetical protein